MSIAKIRCPGGLAKHLVVEQVRSECGDVEDGIGVRWEGCPAGVEDVAWRGVFVLSWEDFEAAYLRLRELRSAPLAGETKEG